MKKLRKLQPLQKSIPIQLGFVLLVLAAATLLSMLFRSTGYPEVNIVVIYTLSVLMVARFTKGYGYGILASVIGIFCFNFFFTEPLHTLNVYNKSYLITFLVMLLASLLTSTLTSKILRSSMEATRWADETNILYRFTSSLAKASGVSEVATISVQSLSNLLDCDVYCIMTDPAEPSCKEFSIKRGERKVSVASLKDGQEQAVVQRSDVWPIADQSYQYGVICLPKDRIIDQNEQGKLLSAITSQIFAAMERERLAHEKEQAKGEAEREKFKSHLLRSISHDLRTPLTGICGAAEVLCLSLKDEETRKLAEGIYEDSNWLTRMIENILSLTKIQEGELLVNKQPEALEEIVGEAVRRTAKFSGSHAIDVDIPSELLFVPMDGRLIEQVLINLLDNSIKYSQPESPIKLEVAQERNRVWFAVRDQGSRLSSEELSSIFTLFYKTNRMAADSHRGMGLGLSICKAIVEAHGGEICAQNNENGLTIRFYLPLSEVGHDGK